MASLKLFSSVAIIFLATSSFSFNGCHADPALIESICKQSQDYDFCTSALNNDPRSATADLRGLALVSTSLTVIQIQDTLDRIPDILKRLNEDSPDHQRVGVCQNDYNGSLKNFQGAFNAVTKSDFWDTINFVRDGTNQVIDCHNIFRRDPITTSPIAGDDIKVFKLSEIILLFVDRLINKK